MAFKMKGSPIKLGSIATKSALKQHVENVKEGSGTVSLDGTDYHKGEGNTIIPYSEEAKAAHLTNVQRLSDLDISADEMNTEMAKTRHLPNPNPVVDEEPTVYPKNPKVEQKTRKRRKGINIDFRKTRPRRGGSTIGGRIGYKLIPRITRKGTGITFGAGRK